jgi:16S rRNA (guanine527-N7)-methyltransferase
VFHVKHDDLRDTAEALGSTLDGDALDRLRTFERLLRDRAVPLGFVGAADAPVIAERHVLDCLRAAPLLEPGTVVDLGSGAGLPGIVVAIARPDVLVDLIEAQRRRLAFLELAVERLDLENARPVGRRVQDLRGSYSSALARAFADPPTAWAAAERLLAPAGSLVYFAGRRFRPAALDDLRVRTRLVPAHPLLASAGPLVIMTRQ